MVRALLAGRKTQTRRVVRWPFEGQPQGPEIISSYEAGEYLVRDNYVRCPYGAPGDRLWVRETFCFRGETIEGRDRYRYRADVDPATDGWRWTPAIHMPRRACRLVLEVTGVRVERLQEISDMDAMREGCEQLGDNDGAFRASYRLLWDSLNAKRGFCWSVNPWVWVIEFKRSNATRSE